MCVVAFFDFLHWSTHIELLFAKVTSVATVVSFVVASAGPARAARDRAHTTPRSHKEGRDAL